MGYKNWRTPTGEGGIFSILNKRYHFTMDAAASHANHLLPVYCTEVGKFRTSGIEAPEQINSWDGKDARNWIDERAFCNPPYDNDIAAWINTGRVAVSSGHCPLACFLLPPSVDTKWYDDIFPETIKNAVICGDEHFNWVVWSDTLVNMSLGTYKGRARFLRPSRVLEDGSYDETDTKSVLGESPRAGNLVLTFETKWKLPRA